MSQNGRSKTMLRHPRSQVYFLLQDAHWRTAIERFRSPQAAWNARWIGDWNDLVQAVATKPWSFSIIEVTASDIVAWIRRIERIGKFGSNHRVAVLGSREIRPFAEFLDEAGAIFCGFSIGDCPRLAQMIERFEINYPPQPLPLRESILNRLPWSPAADPRTWDRTSATDDVSFTEVSPDKND